MVALLLLLFEAPTYVAKKDIEVFIDSSKRNKKHSQKLKKLIHLRYLKTSLNTKLRLKTGIIYVFRLYDKNPHNNYSLIFLRIID